MKINFAGLEALSRGTPRQTCNVFDQCWDMLERYYSIGDDDATWEMLLSLSEQIYRSEIKTRGKLPAKEIAALEGAIMDTLRYIEAMSKYRSILCRKESDDEFSYLPE